MKSRARWAKEAIDLSDNLAMAADQLTLSQLADATNLSPKTIEDSLTRRKITSPDSPRGAIDRPKYMVGGNPLWSTGQLAEFARRFKIKRDIVLPLVSSTEAQERRLISTNELADLLGIHNQTVRRWEANYRDDYPDAVGRRSRDGRPGVPDHVRELDKIIEWIRTENEERHEEGADPLVELPDIIELPAAIAS